MSTPVFSPVSTPITSFSPQPDALFPRYCIDSDNRLNEQYKTREVPKAIIGLSTYFQMKIKCEEEKRERHSLIFVLKKLVHSRLRYNGKSSGEASAPSATAAASFPALSPYLMLPSCAALQIRHMP